VAKKTTAVAVDPRFENGPLAVIDCEDGQVSAYCVGGLVLDVPAKSLSALVKKRWQPQIRAKAKKKAASTDGIVVSTKARFGFTAAPGTTDDARVRHITQALPPLYAERLFAARDAGATEDRLRQIAAEGLGEMYFRDNNHRAHDLLVEFTDVERLDIEL
jgi:hypothetical protein